MIDKSTSFCSKTTINCRGKLLDFSSPCVMGIVNATPDSFYDGGKNITEKALLMLVKKHLKDGAAIIDVGGYSTRPGAKHIEEKEEAKRVVPAIKSILKHFPEAIVSVDTFRSNVAVEAIAEGAHIINDVSGGTLDKKMFQTAAKLKVPYILMHIKGTPQNMQVNPKYDDVVQEIISYFAEKIELLKSQGIIDVIIDPGFGFGKSTEHNYRILKNLNLFKIFGLPLLAGISRKSMVCNVLKTKPINALNGTTALHTIALLNGANILRAHDVKEASETINLFKSYSQINI